MNRLYISCFFILASPWSALGQFLPQESKYYIGSDLLHNNTYEVLYPSAPNLGGVGPWRIVIGTQLNPKLAVQIGYSYSYESTLEDPYLTGTTDSGAVVTASRYSGKRAHAFPVLGRYAVLNPHVSRWRLQILLGLTVLHSWNEFRETAKIGQVVEEFYSTDKVWQLYVTGGLEAGYHFGRHFETVANITWNKNLEHSSNYTHFITTGNNLGITNGLSIGMRYHFNLKK